MSLPGSKAEVLNKIAEYHNLLSRKFNDFGRLLYAGKTQDAGGTALDISVIEADLAKLYAYLQQFE